MRNSLLVLGACFAAGLNVHAQDPFATNIRPTPPLAPQEQLQKFHLPPGFEIQLFAAEPDIQKPMNMAFDARGRLWVTGSFEYPYAAESREARDTIRVLEDSDADGRADKITTFADGLNIPMGLYPYRDGVVAYSIPSIYFFRDRDDDGRCDDRQVLYGPLGKPVDTHGMQNAFRRGFDGWLYICHGFRNESVIRGRDGSEIKLQSGNTYRVKLDGSRVEQFTWGQVNPFGSTFTPAGDLIVADCHSKPLSLLLRGGYYTSFGRPHDGLGFVPAMLDHTHGSTAIAGAAFYTGSGFPAPYRGSLFVGNVMTSRVHRDDVVWHGSTMQAREAEDFLTCDDPWFRPVDLRIGPDGALYIADFYNRIIGHYEVPLDHPGRDRRRGRIWRVSYRGRDAAAAGNSHDWSTASAGKLIETLSSTSLAVRSLATDQLSDRLGDQAASRLHEAAKAAERHVRVHSLWALFRLGKLTEQELADAARDNHELVRTHAMRVLSELADWSPSQQQLAVAALTDDSALVRRAAADAVGRHGDDGSISPLLSALRAAPERDKHLRHTILIALRNQLRKAGAFRALQTADLDRAQRLALCQVALAVPSAGAAEFLIATIESGLIDQARLHDQLRHAATHVAEPDLDALVQLIRRQSSSDLKLQVELIALLQQQLLQRGSRRTTSLEAWGSELARELLASIDRTSTTWNSPSPRNVWGLERRDCEDGERAVRFLSSLPGGERATGVLQSHEFELPNQLSFYLCGHLGFPKNPAIEKNVVRLRLATDGRIVKQASPPRSDLAQRIVWDLDAIAGQRAYVELVDGIDLNAYAWLAVSRFEPPAIALPDVAPIVTADRQVAAATIAKTLKLRELKGPLTKLARSPAADWRVRVAANEALYALDPLALGNPLLGLLQDDTVAFSTRTQIARKLTDRDEGELAELWPQVMRAIPTRLQEQVASELAANARGAEFLLTLVERGHASARLLQRPSLRQALSRTGPKDVKGRMSALTASFPPLDEQLDRLLQQRAAGFHAATPSVDAGKQSFEKHCAACHQVHGMGGMIGPQLDGIGNRGLERILEDVLDPNRNIDAAFHVTIVATTDGKVLTGLFRRREGKAHVFAGPNGKEFRVLGDDIEQERKVRNSIMPDNVATLLGESAFYDLVSYLLSLRK